MFGNGELVVAAVASTGHHGAQSGSAHAGQSAHAFHQSFAEGNDLRGRVIFCRGQTVAQVEHVRGIAAEVRRARAPVAAQQKARGDQQDDSRGNLYRQQ